MDKVGICFVCNDFSRVIFFCLTFIIIFLGKLNLIKTKPTKLECKATKEQDNNPNHPLLHGNAEKQDLNNLTYKEAETSKHRHHLKKCKEKYTN